MPTHPNSTAAAGGERPPDTHLRSVVQVTDLSIPRQTETWAWAEVACYPEPAIAFHIPLDPDDWTFLDPDTAIALGAALIRIAGAAHASHYYEPTDGPGLP